MPIIAKMIIPAGPKLIKLRTTDVKINRIPSLVHQNRPDRGQSICGSTCAGEGLSHSPGRDSRMRRENPRASNLPISHASPRFRRRTASKHFLPTSIPTCTSTQSLSCAPRCVVPKARCAKTHSSPGLPQHPPPQQHPQPHPFRTSYRSSANPSPNC